eukprot:s50_g8.t1
MVPASGTATVSRRPLGKETSSLMKLSGTTSLGLMKLSGTTSLGCLFSMARLESCTSAEQGYTGKRNTGYKIRRQPEPIRGMLGGFQDEFIAKYW